MGGSENDILQAEPMKLKLTECHVFTAVALSDHEADSSPSSMLPGYVVPPPGLKDVGSEKATSAVANRTGRSSQKEYRHKQVPKNVNLEEEYKYSGLVGAPTTLMIRNIPNRYTQHELIQELDALGFAGTFDFFYMPVDQGRHRHHGMRKSTSNVGYAFVNFIKHVDAEACVETMRDYVFKMYGNKVAIISIAHIQGLEANLAHYEKTAVNAAKSEHGPLVMPNLTSVVANKHSTISEVDLEGWAPAEAGLWADWRWSWPAPVDPWLSPSVMWETSSIPGEMWPNSVDAWGHGLMPGAIAPGVGIHAHRASGHYGKKAAISNRKAAAKHVAQIGGA